MLLGFIISERGIEANPEKILHHYKHGPNLEPKRGSANHGVSHGTKPFHLTSRRARVAPLSASKEDRSFCVDS
jgi:hypothetical protein